MSTQTGIVADEALNAFFGRCRQQGSRVRMFKVVIEKERLTLDSFAETGGDWQQDWDLNVLQAVEEAQPCFILYRLDEREGSFYRWLLISWSPDNSSVRNKMLYASTKATLKKEFGAGQIKDDLYGNVKEDVSLEGYRRHAVSAAAPGPLSREELEREEVKAQQATSAAAIAVDTKHQTMTGLTFPLAKEAQAAVHDIINQRVDYVQLSIDVQREMINLEWSGRCGPSELRKRAPADKPRYHIFVYRHTHEGDAKDSAMFIYTMPGYSCTIKERMLYSSCLNGVVDHLGERGLIIEKKVQVDSAEELTEEFLYEELHPVKNLHRPKFAKPAPPSRGNRRITKQPVA